MTLEREVEQRLVRLAHDAHGVALKFIPDNMRGMPDRLVLLPGGVLVWVETKRPRGGKLSPVQAYRHKQLRELGQTVAVCSSLGEVDELIASLRTRDSENKT